jgi:hypothetical protein
MSFHINPKTGDSSRCSAAQGNCPFGDAKHFDSQEEARSAYEAAMENFSKVYEKSTNTATIAKAAEEVVSIRRDEELDTHLQNAANALNEARQTGNRSEKAGWKDDAYDSVLDGAGIINEWTNLKSKEAEADAGLTKAVDPKLRAQFDALDADKERAKAEVRTLSAGWNKAGAGRLNREDGSYMERDDSSGVPTWYFKLPNGDKVNRYPDAPQFHPLHASSARALQAEVQNFEKDHGPIKP